MVVLTNPVDGKYALDSYLQQRFMCNAKPKTFTNQVFDRWKSLNGIYETSYSTSLATDTSHVLVGNGTNKFVTYNFSFNNDDLEDYFSIWFCERFNVSPPEYKRFVEFKLINDVIEQYIHGFTKHINKLYERTNYGAINSVGKDLIIYFDQEAEYVLRRLEIARRAYLDDFEKKRLEKEKSDPNAMKNAHLHKGKPDGEKTGSPNEGKSIFQIRQQSELAKIKPWWKFWK